jgi:predicted DNA-binding transcriptional regulator AlpA
MSDETKMPMDDRERAREMLRREFAIDSAFVRVPELSRVLGLAECTIYAAMRGGRFFIPHRVLLSSPAVRLDDLVDWYCSEGSGRRRGQVELDASGSHDVHAADGDAWAALRRSVARRGKRGA